MPRIYQYEVLAIIREGRVYTSATQETLIPDDLPPEQVADAIDGSITRVWNDCLINQRPFQLGLCIDVDTQHLVTATIAPQHLVMLQTTILGSRPATEEEVAAAMRQVQQMPQIRFIPETEQPPAEDDEGLLSGSQPA
jgi:hypothetical protein